MHVLDFPIENVVTRYSINKEPNLHISYITVSAKILETEALIRFTLRVVKRSQGIE